MNELLVQGSVLWKSSEYSFDESKRDEEQRGEGAMWEVL